MIKHQRVPRPFPGDYDMESVSNTEFVNGRLSLVFNTYYNQQREHFLYEFDQDLAVNKITKLPIFNNQVGIYWITRDSLNCIELIGDSRELKGVEVTGKGNLVYMKLDSNMKILKRVDYTGNFNIFMSTAEIYTVIRNPDRSFVVTAYDWVRFPNDFYGIPYTIKFSPEFDTVIWKTRMYGTFEEPKIQRRWINYCDKMKDNSGYVVCGDQSDQRVGGTQKYGIIYKVSEKGDSLWLKKYLPLSWNEERASGMSFYQIKCTDYNTMVVGGVVGDNMDQVIKGWLLHLDSDGCLVPGCNGTVNTGSEINEDQVFKIFPNPVRNDKIYLLCNKNIPSSEFKIRLMSLEGKVLKESKFYYEAGLQIILDIPRHIVEGQYILNLENKSKIYNMKILIERN
ncbi:MAG: T9SS type A sorting domain-containing protein [Bacteroidota bacterium]|nr:T9SS type A sorting domain-containing protein [Bacteroidota bacterium]